MAGKSFYSGERAVNDNDDRSGGEVWLSSGERVHPRAVPPSARFPRKEPGAGADAGERDVADVVVIFDAVGVYPWRDGATTPSAIVAISGGFFLHSQP